MCINIVLYLILFFSSVAYSCDYQLTNTTGTVIFPSYENNIECLWVFNLSGSVNSSSFRYLLITFHYFDTEFGHDELFIGETISDVSRYNSKLFRFSGSKLPDPCLISLRGDIQLRPIWMQFLSDHTTTGLGFTLDYAFLVNQSSSSVGKSAKLSINADIRENLKSSYSFPNGNLSSPNYPQNYSNNMICRWHFFHRHAFIRLNIAAFQTEYHYDTFTIYLGQNLNNRAMILYEWSGDEMDNKHLFIPNDNILLVFQTDKTNNASGFSLHYEIIVKENITMQINDNYGVIQSNNYPNFLRTNVEYTWIIHMNLFNEIQIELSDIHLDYEHDYLQVNTGGITYTLDTPRSYRFSAVNETKIILRTKHADDDYRYRGFNLTYQKWNTTAGKVDEWKDFPCGKKYSSANGTIEFQHQTLTSFDCLILIEVDDGQNILLRFDYLNWDNQENYIEIGLFHNPNEYRLFHLSDTLPGTWFIANDSQIWIRFYSSQFSLDVSLFRLFYTETIRWSTVTPKPYVQVLDDHRLFPYRLISLPTNSIYHNLTQAYIWHVEALDDECVQIRFESLQTIGNRRLCFQIKDSSQTRYVCNNEQLPFASHHIGSCILSVEPEFIWMLVEYNIQIDKYKKMLLSHYLTFNDDSLILTPSLASESYISIEWIISLNDSSGIIFDIENFDGKTPAELILPENENSTKSYSLDTISTRRFAHVLSSQLKSFRIVYTSWSLLQQKQKRLFRLNLYKISKGYFNFRDFYYISYQSNQSTSLWTIRGQYENSTFSAVMFSSNPNLILETTANTNLSSTTTSIPILNYHFNIRLAQQSNVQNSNFLVILYEQEKHKNISMNKTSSLIETNDFALYDIHLPSTSFNSIDFIIIQGDNGTSIRLFDLNTENNDYFLLNLSSIKFKQISSLIGLRFSIKSLHIQIELHSLTKTPIQLRYKGQLASIPTNTSHKTNNNLHNLQNTLLHCFIPNINLCDKNTSQTCTDSCASIFDQISSSSMNNTRKNHFWPYALRGSVTLIIENATMETFENRIYRNLRQSIAKAVRKFCLKFQSTCLSKDTEFIRADHVIVQSYEEESADHRLFVAIFIKDPYRQTIALTNDQFLLALKRYQQDIYQDIKHQIHLPSNVLEHTSVDPIWLFYPTNLHNQRMNRAVQKLKPEKDRLIISSPLQLATEEDEQISSTCYNETDTSQASTSAPTANLLPTKQLTNASCSHYFNSRPSYFHSTIESAIKQRFDTDNEPIPFIDDNLSIAHSRKSSACWSDRTSLSSRFSLVWKAHSRRSGSQNRSTISTSNDKRRKYNHRPSRYTFSAAQQSLPNDEL
ncbi:unnamed protein product [Adineta ricciae]|uniref:CUB domain-containing protein n=1 Tax=Adineta ricciae TaxID=249248 RepID=A0A814VL75_ADIRI|nr:unnamed protein product [Adineta ricciae]